MKKRPINLRKTWHVAWLRYYHIQANNKTTMSLNVHFS